MVKKKSKETKSASMKSKGSKADKQESAEVGSIAKKVRKSSKQITTSSTAEYFSKNLQQVGFSSPTKAVLTTLKEAMDNALDACEDGGILPDIKVLIEKQGAGSLKNTDKILIRVEDNGPGLDVKDIPKVFGEYLASSKFGRGRCSRGQQGIGISAATTWAMQTTATGARVITKQKKQKNAVRCIVDMDLKNNKGLIREKESINWDKPQGTTVEFVLDGRIQLKGEGGLLTYLRGNVLLNPHLRLEYDLGEGHQQVIERVSEELPSVPEATDPHPHTMKLGEFISHARLFGRVKTGVWLRKGFSRVSERVLQDMVKEAKLPKDIMSKGIDKLTDAEFRDLFVAVQNTKLMAPATNTVMSVGEDGLALSIQRIGDIDFFSVLTRKPMIADFKPVQIEVAIARLRQKASESEDPVQVLRFANRVPLQFDKSACAIVKAINSVNWRSYGLRQPRSNLPLGPYIIAVSMVSPFIKFKNASKETIDASEELVEELRRALMQAGQRLSRYLRREHKAGELEQKVQHIEQFGPILVETLGRILQASEARKTRASDGLKKILERDTKGIKEDLQVADNKLSDYLEKKKERLSGFFAEIEAEKDSEKKAKKKKDQEEAKDGNTEAEEVEETKSTKKKASAKSKAKKSASSKRTAKQSTAKKTPAKKATAKKSAPKKTTAKQKTAQKATTKKTTAKKAKKKGRK